MSELPFRDASPVAPVPVSERIKLGRILHLDRSLSKTARARWESHIFVHGFFGLLVTFCVLGMRDEPENAAFGFLCYVFALTWIATTGIMELMIRQNAAYELQLLPFGIRLTTVDGTVELIEPEVVGGKWLRWSKFITLRQGKQEAKIALARFMHRRERAAIIEHCSQFLSPVQQAEFGTEWTRAFYELITPAKPSLRGCLVACAQGYGLICLALVMVTEGILLAYPDAVTLGGMSLRTMYWALLLVPGIFVGPLVVAHAFETRLRGKRRGAKSTRPEMPTP